jgi:hypothetical protein
MAKLSFKSVVTWAMPYLSRHLLGLGQFTTDQATPPSTPSMSFDAVQMLDAKCACACQSHFDCHADAC